MKEYLTSSASSSLPSWNLTPLRSRKIQVLSSGVSQVSARAGLMLRSLSHSSKESYMNSLPHMFEVGVAPYGIKLTGSWSMAQVSLPPRLPVRAGAAAAGLGAGAAPAAGEAAGDAAGDAPGA